MGQANNRGTYEQRVEMARSRNASFVKQANEGKVGDRLARFAKRYSVQRLMTVLVSTQALKPPTHASIHEPILITPKVQD